MHYAIADLGAVVVPGACAGHRGAPPRADGVPARRLGAAAPAGALRGRREPAARRPARGRAVADRPRRRGRAGVGRRTPGGGPRRGPGSTTRACRPPSTPAGSTRRSRPCPRSGRCAARWPCAAGRSSWSCPSRRSCARRTVARTADGPSRSGAGAPPSRTGTPRSRCSPASPPRGSCSTPGSACCAPCPPRSPTPSTALRAVARGLGIDWPAAHDPGRAAVRRCPATPPPALALRRAATSLLRGAGYTAFDTAAGAPPPADPGHAGIGAPYAHVTAPLRRLVDRFGTEVCLAADGRGGRARLAARGPARPARDDGGVRRRGRCGGPGVRRPDGGRAARGPGRGGASTSSCCGRRPTAAPGEVYLHDPPVLARCTGALRLGETARVRLVEADPVTGRIAFTTVG